MKPEADRILGFLALLSAIAVTLEARSFRVGFYTDPLGASGLPLIAAALIGLGGGVLVLHPHLTVTWADRRTLLTRSAVVVTGLFLYSTILPIVGFLLSTTVAVAAFAVVFGGPVGRSLLLAGAYTAALYALFSILLGLSLPIGSLFLVGA